MIGNSIAGFLGTGVATATSSYESIATSTPSGVSTITFSSIPSTYKHLQIRMIARNANAAASSTELNIRFNGDTASNYTIHALSGNGSAASAQGYTAQTSGWSGWVGYNGLAASIYGVGITDIIDYASTSKNKTFRTIGGLDNNSTGGTIELSSGVWLSTAAINSITIFSGSNFNFGTTFALYGING